MSKKNKLIKCLSLFLLTVFISVTPLPAFAEAYLDIVGKIESSGNYATNTGNGAYGKYQFQKKTLQGMGYINQNGTWTGKDGLNSMSDFLACSTCQDNAALNYSKATWAELNNRGIVDDFLGTQTSGGVTLNEGALLECAHIMGGSACSDYLRNGCSSATCQKYLAANPGFEKNLARASEGDVSAITGKNGLTVDNSSMAAGGTVSNNSALAQIASYCAKEVQALLNTAGEQAVNNHVTIAGNSETGYTLMNGQGLLDDALKNGGGIGNLTPGATSDSDVSSLLGGTLSNAGYRTASCLDNLLNSITSVGGVFSNINLGNILTQLQNQACSKAQSQFSSIVQPIQSEISNLNGNLQVGGGGFLPSMQIGTIGLSNSSNNTTFRSMLENNSDWYKANANSNGLSNSLNVNLSPSSTVNLFGGLFSGDSNSDNNTTKK